MLTTIHQSINQSIGLFFLFISCVSANHQPFLLAERKGVALYSVFCGQDNSNGDAIKSFSLNITHYLITDNDHAGKRAKDLGWSVIMMNGNPYSNADDSNMKCKLPRTMPTLFGPLDNYEFLIYIDTKHPFSKEDEKILGVMDIFQKNPQLAFIGMLHPNHPYGGPWSELDEALRQPRYSKDKEHYIQYINSRQTIFNSSTVLIKKAAVMLGTVSFRNNNHPMVQLIGFHWYSEILASGIEDQISSPFVVERYKHHIYLLPYDNEYFTIPFE